MRRLWSLQNVFTLESNDLADFIPLRVITTTTMTHKTTFATFAIHPDATPEEYLARMAEIQAKRDRLIEELVRLERRMDRQLAEKKQIDQHIRDFDVGYKKVVSEEHFRRYREIADRGDEAALIKFFEDSIRAREARMSRRQAHQW